MTNLNDIVKYWSGAKAAKRSYPTEKGRFADPDHVGILQRLCKGFVCEVGCGTGRCSDAFEPDGYVGIDINPEAIEIAKTEKPKHAFKVIRWHDEYPDADTYLFHTCLMHVPDDLLDSVLLRAKPRVVIFESMMLEYSNPEEFNFQRTRDAYKSALQRCGFDMVGLEDHSTLYQSDRRRRLELRRRFMVGETNE